MPGIASVGNACCFHTPEDRVELAVFHMERVVMALESVPVVKVEGKRRVYTHGREMPARSLVGEAKNLGEEPGCRLLVTRRHDRVIQYDGHGSVLLHATVDVPDEPIIPQPAFRLGDGP